MAGKIYALSDLHGHYEIMLAMLRKIRFDDSDTLYMVSAKIFTTARLPG